MRAPDYAHPDDELSYLHEYEYVTLARLLLARHRRDRDDRALEAALGLLDRLLAAAQDGGRAGSLLEVLILQALAHQARATRRPAAPDCSVR
jgi:LuxR family maltose regulon positive regulatory protein